MTRTALITGGTGGMGLATARLLGRGHRIVLADLSRERPDAAVAELAAEGFADAVLWVTESNARAQQFYTRHGFTPTGDRQPVRDGEEPMEMKMRRELV